MWCEPRSRTEGLATEAIILVLLPGSSRNLCRSVRTDVPSAELPGAHPHGAVSPAQAAPPRPTPCSPRGAHDLHPTPFGSGAVSSFSSPSNRAGQGTVSNALCPLRSAFPLWSRLERASRVRSASVAREALSPCSPGEELGEQQPAVRAQSGNGVHVPLPPLVPGPTGGAWGWLMAVGFLFPVSSPVSEGERIVWCFAFWKVGASFSLDDC